MNTTDAEQARYDVFLSYTAHDSALACRVHDELLALIPNIKIYLFEKIENDAEDFRDDYEKALKITENFCLIDSPNARRSKWVYDECKLAMKLLDSGRLKKFIPCLLQPLGGWREPRNYPDLKFHSAEYIDLFDKINTRRTTDLFGFTTYDHEEILHDQLISLCRICGLRPKKLSILPEVIDFEDELTAYHVDRKNKEIFVRDFEYFLLRKNLDIQIAKKRLEILSEECGHLGYRITDDLLKKFEDSGSPAELIKALSSEELKNIQFTTRLSFENAVAKAFNYNNYEPYMPAIVTHAKQGLRFFSIEMAHVRLQISDHKFSDAYAALKNIVDLFPKETRGWNALGRMHDHFGNFELAVKAQNKALACIDDPDNARDIFLQSNKILVQYDKIKSLIKWGNLPDALAVLKTVDEKFHKTPTYKMAQARIFIGFGQFEIAIKLLNQLYAIHKNESENWAAYKLTKSKLKRLQLENLPLYIFNRLEVIEDVAFFSKEAFHTHLRRLIGANHPATDSKYMDTITEIARYDRGIRLKGITLADVEYNLYAAFRDRREFELAHEPILRCTELVSESLKYLTDLALVQRCLKLPNAGTIEAGLLLSPKTEYDKEDLATLYYLKGDLEKAKSYFRDIGQIREQVEYFNCNKR